MSQAFSIVLFPWALILAIILLHTWNRPCGSLSQRIGKDFQFPEPVEHLSGDVIRNFPAFEVLAGSSSCSKQSRQRPPGLAAGPSTPSLSPDGSFSQGFSVLILLDWLGSLFQGSCISQLITEG